MARSFLLLPLLLAALPLGTVQAADRFNRGVDSVHQPVIQRSDHVFDVGGNGLNPVESAQVAQWFDAIGLAYGDRISIDTSVGAASSNRDIAAIVGLYGLFVSDGAPVTQGAIRAGDVRIVVSRSIASVPGCPDYSQSSQPNFTAAASSNYGCGTNATLAAMVANPEDLVKGQEARGSSPETAAKAIKVWRNAAPTAQGGLKVESTQGGK